jgi:hypothetical protein
MRKQVQFSRGQFSRCRDEKSILCIQYPRAPKRSITNVKSMNLARRQPLATALLPYFFLLAFSSSVSAQENKPRVTPTPGPMLAEGTIELQTPDFNLVLVRSSQTVAELKPKSVPEFDFTPSDLLIERSRNGYFHLGDISSFARRKRKRMEKACGIPRPSGRLVSSARRLCGNEGSAHRY